MSTRSDYTVEEWEAIRRAPAEAVIAVEQASPSSFLGRRRERKAAERGLSVAIARYGGLELVDAIVAASDEEGRLIDALRSGGESYLETALVTARTARHAVEAKATTPEAEAYASAVLETAEAVALASGEHGGRGNMSAGEALLLRRLAGALGRPDYEPPQDDTLVPTAGS